MALSIGYTDQQTSGAFYAILQSSAETFWNPTAATFTAFTAIGDHDIPLIEGAARHYRANLSDNFASGEYIVRVYQQAGGSPDLNADRLRTVRGLYYSGSAMQEISTGDIWDALQSICSGGGSGTASLDEILDWVKSIASRVRAH